MSRTGTIFRRLQPLTDIVIFLACAASAFFAARLVLLHFLLPDIRDTGSILKALYIGLKFDVRMAVFLSLPTAFCLLVPRLERAVSRPGRSTARTILAAVTGVMSAGFILACIIDFGFFFYLHQHVDMGAAVFLEDPSESVRMVWQSYPVLLIAACAAAVEALCVFLHLRLLKHHAPASQDDGNPGGRRIGRRAVVAVLSLLLLFVAGYGQVSSNLFPLRWSNAYFSPDKNIALLAVNPVQNLYDTRNYGKAVRPDAGAVREAWPRMAAYLRIPGDRPAMDFLRFTPGRPGGGKLNVVVIIMESLCWERTSLAPSMPPELGPDINPTPFLKELAGRGLYFPNFYAPARTTARAVFTTISGVPDVNHSGGTTSRNPKLVDQNTLVSQFGGYEKYYMIGGNANWANIRGLIQYNTKDLHLLEESSWKAPNTDVWGISDIALFREALDVLDAGRKPFLAVIQTASFHRPYTIPEDNEGFAVPPVPSRKAMDWYGYENPEEFRSMCLADHALRRFFEKASAMPWFRNTVFAVFGDHGLNHDSANITPAVQACNLQAWHVPLVLYAPGGQIAPGVNPAPHVQPDVLETLACAAGVPHYSNTMGRNMLDPANDRDAVAFISHTDHDRYLVSGEFVYAMHPRGDALYRLSERTASGRPHDLKKKMPGLAADMRREAMDFYRTSQYLLHNNGKDIVLKAEQRAGGK